MSSALSMQNSVQLSPKSIKKELLQSRTRHLPRQRKPNDVFVKEANIENADKHATPAIRIFVKNIRKLFACNAIANRLKAIVLVVNFILQFPKRFEVICSGSVLKSRAFWLLCNQPMC